MTRLSIFYSSGLANILNNSLNSNAQFEDNTILCVCNTMHDSAFREDAGPNSDLQIDFVAGWLDLL